MNVTRHLDRPAGVAASSGQQRLAAAFAGAGEQGRAALMPYLMGGFPDLETSVKIGLAYAGAGADVIELGVPFSDPLADGPVIHAAGTRALAAGTTLAGVLDAASRLASAAPSVPIVLMCYSNLVLARGGDAFADLLGRAGVSGLIVPDLPFEEASAVLESCDRAGVALVPLIAPTSTDARLAGIAAMARGFVYAVSVTGTTGERAALSEAFGPLVARARRFFDLPVAVGFGIGAPDQAVQAARAGADGVIVGSRLVREVAEAAAACDGDSSQMADAAGALVADFAAALREAPGS